MASGDDNRSNRHDAAAIGIYLIHNIRIATIRDYKGKYNYINEK